MCHTLELDNVIYFLCVAWYIVVYTDMNIHYHVVVVVSIY